MAQEFSNPQPAEAKERLMGHLCSSGFFVSWISCFSASFTGAPAADSLCLYTSWSC